MEDFKQCFYETRIDETIKNLKKHEFEAFKVLDRASACNEVLKRILPTKTVGLAGSVTIREIGLFAELEKQGNPLFNHWQQGLTKEESLKTRRSQQSCDVYLSSVNAITVSGEIVNVDGFCNRISAMAFGPGEVIMVAGKNKIVQDVPEGLARIRNIAGPINARRFNPNLPCAKVGRCVDCDSPDRICRGTLILERKPFATNILVIIVPEDLGY